MGPVEESYSASPPDPEDEHLVRVLEGYLSDLESGRPADPQRLLAEHPSISPRLKVCLAGLHLLGDASGDHDAVSATPGQDFGDYTLIREVGRGGMGIVFEALHRQRGKRFALKLIPKAAVLDARQLVRFKNEAQAAARLHHPNIVPVHDVGFADGCHFYTMQFISGSSLARQIDKQRRQRSAGRQSHDADFRAAAEYMQQAALALDHAHRVGIIHRDVKPANLLVQADGHLWVTDFGLASVQGSDGLTATGDVVGTLRYMSPEQASARRGVVDHRTDIYALGATLYELLTLQPAVNGLDRQQLLEHLSFGEPRPPRRIDPRVPVDLETIALKAMAHWPEDRYSTAASLAHDLAHFLAAERIEARRPGLLATVRKRLRRHPTLAAAIGLAVLLITVGLAISTATIWGALQAEEQQRALAEVRELDSRRHAYDGEMNLAFAEWERGHAARVFELLERQRPSPGEQDLRGFEWHYLWGLCHRATRGTLAGHTGRVRAIAVRKQKWITASDDGTIRIWDPATFALQHTIQLGSDRVAGMAASPDGNHLVAALGYKLVRYFDLVEGNLAEGLRGPEGHCSAVAMSDDGSTLVLGGNRTFAHQLGSGNSHGIELTGQQQWPNCIAVSADGALVAASGNERRVLLWDLTSPTSAQSVVLGQHPSYVLSIAMSPDRKTLLTGSEDGFVQLWDLLARQAKGESQRCHIGAVSAAAFSPDGRLVATGSWEGSVKVWDVASAKPVHQFGHPGQVSAVAFTADGDSLLTGGEDGMIRIWDLSQPPSPQILAGHSKLIRGLAFDADGSRLLSASADGSARVWDLSGPKSGLPLNQPQEEPPEWMRTQGWVRPSDSHWRMGCAFLPSGQQVLVADVAGRLGVYDARSGRALRTFEEAGGPIWSLAISPDGSSVAAAGYRSNSVYVWDAASGKKRATLQGHSNRVWSVAFSPDGRLLASAAADRTARIWNASDGQLQSQIHVPAEFPWLISFSPDSRTVAVATDDCCVRSWEVRTGRQLETLARHASTVRAFAFFPDGKSLVSGGDDGTVRIWGLATGQEHATLQEKGASIWSLAVSPDGRIVAGGDNKGRITVWNSTP